MDVCSFSARLEILISQSLGARWGEANRTSQPNTTTIEENLRCLTRIEKDLGRRTSFEKAFQCRRTFLLLIYGFDEMWKADYIDCTCWSNVYDQTLRSGREIEGCGVIGSPLKLWQSVLSASRLAIRCTAMVSREIEAMMFGSSGGRVSTGVMWSRF